MDIIKIFLFCLWFLLTVFYRQNTPLNNSHISHSTLQSANQPLPPSSSFQLSIRLPIDPKALAQTRILIDELVSARQKCGIDEIKGWELPDPTTIDEYLSGTSNMTPSLLPNSPRTIWLELFIWLQRRGGAQTLYDAIEELQLELSLTKRLCTPSRFLPGRKYKLRFARWLLSQNTRNMVRRYCDIDDSRYANDLKAYFIKNRDIDRGEEGEVRGGLRRKDGVVMMRE